MRIKWTIEASAKQQADMLELKISTFKKDVIVLSRTRPLTRIVHTANKNQMGVDKNSNFESIKKRLSDIFITYLEVDPMFSQVRFIASNNGQEIVRIDRNDQEIHIISETELQNKNSRDYFSAISKLQHGNVYLSDITLNREHGAIVTPHEPMLRIGTPVLLENGEPLGLIVINIQVKKMLDNIQSYFENTDEEIVSYLVNATGDYLTHPNSEMSFGFELGVRHRWTDEYVANGDSYILKKNGEPLNPFNSYLIAQRHVILDAHDTNRKLTILVVAPKSLIIMPFIKSTAVTILTLCFIVFSYFFLKSRSLSKIREEHLLEMTRMKTRFHSIVEVAPHGEMVIDKFGHIMLVNAQIESIFGYERNELIGRSVDILLPSQFQKNHSSFINTYFSDPTVKSMGEGRDLFGLHKNRSQVALEIGLSPLEFDGEMQALCSIVNVSERKYFIEELERSNRDLKNFANLASHDLKSPLRGISQLATWLTEDLKGKIQGEDLENLHLIKVQIKRMESLLDGLLAYSQAGKRNSKIKPTDLKVLIQDVFELNNVHLQFQLILNGDFPTVNISYIPLEQVLRNLISNAIKHHDGTTGTISATFSQDNNDYIFEVADDGPGIADNHKESVFGMFKTLKPRDDIEGSGMGLAIVKKVIETFGGSIKLTDNTPKGARFIFTWPIHSMSFKPAEN